MNCILLDENIPIGLHWLLRVHDVLHVHNLDWAGLSNGNQIAQAEKADFRIMITADQSLRYQQNMKGRLLTLIVLNTDN